MFDFFNQIIGYVQTAFEFLLNLIESLIMAVVYVTTSSGVVLSMAQFMPAIIGTCVVITVAIAVIKFLIGR
ncbi:MAG: hypothetical protein IJA45_01805 [Oscillospiraceae bacterium]|nr:hypothetical protein [Bacteroidaceae bacterium]MBQ3541845.1 hypothetical protein [Oscillospiraceae bacterium]